LLKFTTTMSISACLTPTDLHLTLGYSLRGRNSWRIGFIKMIITIGSLLTGSSSTFCFVALDLWHLLCLVPIPMPNTMHRAAISQDAIGWREFMEGKISKEIAAIQEAHCAISPCRMNSWTDWMKHFISISFISLTLNGSLVTSLCMTNCVAPSFYANRRMCSRN
jgi:hypothetical protein